MTDLQKRLLMFLIGCIGLRVFFVILAKEVDVDSLPILGYLAILPAIGFAIIFLTGSRKTGPEVFGDKIWWNSLRPVHSLLYGLFAYNAINKNPDSYIYLLADVLLGFGSWLFYHSGEHDFQKAL